MVKGGPIKTILLCIGIALLPTISSFDEFESREIYIDKSNEMGMGRKCEVVSVVGDGLDLVLDNVNHGIISSPVLLAIPYTKL